MKTPTHILSTASPKDSLQFMGGKAGNLHHLSSNQIPVPSWFCVSSEMCRHYLSAVSNDIADTLSKVDYSNQDQVDKASDTIKHLICGLELSDADQNLSCYSWSGRPCVELQKSDEKNQQART